MLTFWKNVKDELEYKMMSQKELAAEIKISYNTLQSWITKDRLPDASDSVKIAKALDVSVEFLVTGKKVPLKSKFSPEINTILYDAEHLDKDDLNILKLMANRLANSSLRH